MAEVSGCPNFQELMRLVLGTAPMSDVKRVGQHLLTCRACVDTLHGLKSEDTLIQQLRAQANAAEPAVQQLIESVIRKLQAPTAGSKLTDATEQTQAYGGRQNLLPAESSDFLLGPQVEAEPGLLQEPGQLGRLGSYQILRHLGSGGMGFVFQAEDVHLQRPVALKVMRPEAARDLGARQRFLREARAAAALKHDHIITIYQVGQENDVPFLAMEYLEGETLDSRLSREGKLPTSEVLRIGREIAEGLAAAHERELIHRDIKPANIWLEAGTGRVKILDFGLVRPATGDIHLTGSGMILGTPQYMAPEQARGEAVDARSDLFSLGCVLYRMCSGESAFGGETLMAVLTALAIEEPQSLGNLDRSLPPGLVDLVASLLAKKAEDRPSSARTVADALRALEQGEKPTLVKKSGTRTQLRSSKPTMLIPRPPNWRGALVGAGATLALGLAIFLTWWYWGGGAPAGNSGDSSGAAAVVPPSGPPIKVGILHSRTGTMAISEKSVIDATLLAIEVINEQGGVLGRSVEPVVEDGRSDWPTFADKAEKLITQDQVCTVFGCWTSASRKTVKPLFEKHDHLLFYPVQYEGLELSPNIVYLGAAPNQQLIPAVKWCCAFLKKKRLFLVGSDYVFPRAANAIIRDQAASLGGEVVGEEYLLLGSTDARSVIAKIQASQADVILNTINGDSNVAFFRALRGSGQATSKIPVISFSITEEELGSLSFKDMVGDYAAWNYFQDIDRPQNEDFVRRFRAKYGPERVTTDPMEAAYSAVHLWALAVTAAGKDDPRAIRQAVRGLSFEAPQGKVRIDPETQHCSKFIRIGQVQENGAFAVVYASDEPIQPTPYPATRSRAAWNELLTDLHLRWGGQWANPAKE